jgi:hypothetical protein
MPAVPAGDSFFDDDAAAAMTLDVDGVMDGDGDGRGEVVPLTLGTGDVVALVDGTSMGSVEFDGSTDSDGDGVGDAGDTVR